MTINPDFAKGHPHVSWNSVLGTRRTKHAMKRLTDGAPSVVNRVRSCSSRMSNVYHRFRTLAYLPPYHSWGISAADQVATTECPHVSRHAHWRRRGPQLPRRDQQARIRLRGPVLAVRPASQRRESNWAECRRAERKINVFLLSDRQNLGRSVPLAPATTGTLPRQSPPPPPLREGLSPDFAAPLP